MWHWTCGKKRQNVLVGVKWPQTEWDLTAGELQRRKKIRQEKKRGGLDLGKRSVLVAFWDEHGLLRSPGLFQRLVPLNAALGLACICNTEQCRDGRSCLFCSLVLFLLSCRCPDLLQTRQDFPNPWLVLLPDVTQSEFSLLTLQQGPKKCQVCFCNLGR